MSQKYILATISFLIVAINLVNTQLASDLDLLPSNQPNQRHPPALTRARRMYALCPPDFIKIGNECYFLSTTKESWLDAHFECKDRNSKLAAPLKFADRRLRKYLKNRSQVNDDKWIGGMYNWQLNKWQWGYNGGEMKYQSFGEAESSDMKFHCTTMDPKIDYMWSAKVCTERHNFICQHRMSYVNAKNRQKVYSKWNETYPNQLANEFEVYVSLNGNGNRSLYRTVPKKNRQSPNKPIQSNIVIPKEEVMVENTADYLPYSVYSNLEQMKQKAQEDTIHPLRSPHAANPKQPLARPKKRHSRPLQLTGEVNLGKIKLTNRDKKQRQKQQQKHHQKPVDIPAAAVEETVTNTEEAVTNAGRHHHHKHPNDIEEFETTSPSGLALLETLVFETSPEPIYERTTSFVEKETTSLDMKKKLQDKAMRRDRLRQKLAALTPEEQQAFLLMKKQRAEAKKKGFISN